jgi:hypothetical protein
MAIKYLDSKRIRGSSTSPIIQGYAGGVGGGVDTGNNAAAGGGGGATSVGGSYAENSVGGAGIVNPITGSIIGESSGGNYYLAGGGGGGLSNSGNTGAGGLGGGGDGVQTTGAGSGTANTGAGGGGNTSDSASSGAGGSGVVILKYLTSAINATGGTETTVETSYTISTFTSSGTFEITSGSGSVQYVVVAGGASGGAGGNSAGTDYGCGGGGAGGFLTGTKSMAVGTYTVTIGEGGVAVSPSSAGNDGNNSVFDDVTSTAGGGGCGTTNALKNGRNGGSGGGATRAGTAGTGVSTTQDDKATLITTIAASSADFTDIYDATSASGWTTNAGSGITINNHISGKLSANAIPDNSANRVTKALGLTLSDTSWVAQFEFMRTSGANAHYPFMVAAGTGQIWDATQDHIGIEMNSTGIQIKQRNGSSSTGGTTIAISADTQYYCTIIRNTADLITFEVRTVSHTGSHVSGSPQTLATSSSTSGLTTLHHSGRADGGAGSSSSWQVDNVNIYDGVVALISASSSTNLPENTLFEETDTRETYFLQDNTGISKAGCLGYWKFQEQSGVLTNHATTTNGFTDGLGSAADGTVDAGIDRTATGKFRVYAYEFDNTNAEKVSISDQNGLDITGDITITAWIYPTQGGAGGRFLVGKRTSANANYQFYGRETGGDNLYIAYYDNTNSSKMTTTTEISRNAWHFVAMTISSNTISMWVDMTAQSVGSNTGLSARPANSAALTFGTFDTSTEDYAGRMQDVTIWNRALSEAELTTMYNSGHGMKNIASGLAWY